MNVSGNWNDKRDGILQERIYAEYRPNIGRKFNVEFTVEIAQKGLVKIV